jgi:DNA-binding response OmpR family regulator
MKKEEGHAVVLDEDDPETAGLLTEIVRSRGDRPFVASTVADAIALLEKIDPCYVLADQELPADATSRPLIGGGERVVAHARRQDTRRIDETWHVRPILVVTGWASDPDFVSKMYDLGASAFQMKPLGREGMESLLKKIQTCLERAQRVHHDACARFARPRVSASTAPASRSLAGPRVRIDGEKERTRMIVVVDGQRRTMQESAFVSLLRAIVARERWPDAWSTRASLYIGGSRNATTRIREPFKGLVPDGFDVLESDHLGRFRLSPAVVIEKVDWAAMVEHPNVQIRKIAREQKDRLAASALVLSE